MRPLLSISLSWHEHSACDTNQDYNVTAAAFFFDKHGFVVLEDVLSQPLLDNLKNASTYIMERIFEEDPEGSFGGGAGKLPHRYSLGDARLTWIMFKFCVLFLVHFYLAD